MASMSGWLFVMGVFVLAVTGAAYFSFLDQYISPLKSAMGGLFTVILATIAVVGIFFIALGFLYRMNE